MTNQLELDREPGSRLPLTHQLRFDAGSPAMNLLATVGQRGSGRPAERVPTVARLADWLDGNGLHVPSLDRRDLVAFHALRDCGYPVLSALAAGRRPPADAVVELGRLAARPLAGPALRVGPDRLPLRVPAPVTAESVLTELARELARIGVDRADELRLCDSGECRMVYLDTSRGHRRRWCSMGRCGNTAKAARHRARSATGAA